MNANDVGLAELAEQQSQIASRVIRYFGDYELLETTESSLLALTSNERILTFEGSVGGASGDWKRPKP